MPGKRKTLEETIQEAKKLVRPSEEEKKSLISIKSEIKDLIRKELDRLELKDIQVLVEGSVQKRTWLPGDKDIDIFLSFPKSYKKPEIEKKGKLVGKKVGKKADDFKISYAQHPYVKIQYNGHKIEIVPSYQVNSYKEVKTAVDRTPLHTKYVRSQINGTNLNQEIRLLKKFMKSTNVYGSEKSVKGFSGYITEILIIYYGSFHEVLQKAKEWEPNKIIDPNNWLQKEQTKKKARKTIKRDRENPMIIIDPVDPTRNAAAILSWEKMGEFSVAAKEFLKNPKIRFFKGFQKEDIQKDLSKIINEKGTELLLLSIKRPDLIEDNLFPQLEKTEKSLKNNLEKEGFKVFDSRVLTNQEKCHIFYELDNSQRSRTQIREGPPFYLTNRDKFLEKYDKVWIDNKRLKSEYKVKSSVDQVVKDLIRNNKIGTGKNIENLIKEAKIYLNIAPSEKSEQLAVDFLKKSDRNLRRFMINNKGKKEEN